MWYGRRRNNFISTQEMEYRERIKEEKKAERQRDSLISKKHKPIFTSMLNEMFKRQVDTQYIIHCGKTNSGKTFQAIKALKEKANGIYAAPLRLLAWEIYDKLNTEGYRCDLVTGEEQLISERANYVSCTIEMIDYNKEYDCAVIDESFMIGDDERGKNWLKALLDINAKEIHVIVNHEALEIIKSILTLTKRNFEVKNYDMLQKFQFTIEPTFLSRKLQKGGVFITFSRANVLINKMKLQQLGYNVGVLYGSLPPEVKKKQIQSFIDGGCDLMVATDVIGMGLNLPCNYLVFLDIEKYDGKTFRYLKPIEIRQIAGRVGRYGVSNSENCFVSADGGNKLKFIKNKYNEPCPVTHAYVGFDYKMFSSFDSDMPIIDRIKAFERTNFIPKQLREFIKKEDVTRYMEIAETVDNSDLTLDVKYTFLMAPIKQNNIFYFHGCVYVFAENGIIRSPRITKTKDIKSLEDNISEIELYLNLSRTLKHIEEEKEQIKIDKNELVESLNQMLLDKKLAIKKTCKLCPKQMPIEYPYPYCQECYEEKVRGGYVDYY